MDTTDSRLPRYQQLRDRIAARIARQDWKPGEPIPTESELAAEHAVAIGTVRKAIDVLVSEGLVERAQGRGTFVRRPSFDSSLFRFFRFQGPDGARRVPESRILARERVAAPANVAAALGLTPDSDVIRIARLRLIDGTPVLAEDIWLPFARFAPLMALDPAEFGDLLYPIYESLCGQSVAAARETLAIEPVAAAHGALLSLPAGQAVVVIERLALGYDDARLEWRHSRGPADRFRYQIEIR